MNKLPFWKAIMNLQSMRTRTLIGTVLCIVLQKCTLCRAQVVTTSPPAANSQCRLVGQAFERYSKSSLVDRYAIDKEFPTDFDDTNTMEDYGREAGTLLHFWSKTLTLESNCDA